MILCVINQPTNFSHASLANDNRYHPSRNGSESYYPMIRNDIWDFHTKQTIVKNGPYYPMWQSSPIVPMNHNVPLYNQDNFILFEELDRNIQEKRSTPENNDGEEIPVEVRNNTAPSSIPQAVVTQIINPHGSKNVYTEWIHQYPHPMTPNYDIEPFSFLYYPILATTGTASVSSSDIIGGPKEQQQPDDKTKSEMVGILSVAFYWIGYLQNIPFHDSNGNNLDIITVLKNDCNQIETYRLVSSQMTCFWLSIEECPTFVSGKLLNPVIEITYYDAVVIIIIFCFIYRENRMARM
jgi:hypothetical protein